MMVAAACSATLTFINFISFLLRTNIALISDERTWAALRFSLILLRRTIQLQHMASSHTLDLESFRPNFIAHCTLDLSDSFRYTHILPSFCVYLASCFSLTNIELRSEANWRRTWITNLSRMNEIYFFFVVWVGLPRLGIEPSETCDTATTRFTHFDFIRFMQLCQTAVSRLNSYIYKFAICRSSSLRRD